MCAKVQLLCKMLLDTLWGLRSFVPRNVMHLIIRVWKEFSHNLSPNDSHMVWFMLRVTRKCNFYFYFCTWIVLIDNRREAFWPKSSQKCHENSPHLTLASQPGELCTEPVKFKKTPWSAGTSRSEADKSSEKYTFHFAQFYI